MDYDIDMAVANSSETPQDININTELKKMLDFIINLNIMERTIDFKDVEKVIYLESYSEEEILNNKLYYLKFVSLKYNQVREVINSKTGESKGRLKEIYDGDKEINHVVFLWNKRKMLSAFEYNNYGLFSLNKIILYINLFIEKYFESKKMFQYLLSFQESNVVSKDFIEELNNVKTITMANIFISKKMLDATPFRKVSGRDEIKDEIKIVFKRDKRNTEIPKETIKEFYSLMNEDNKYITKIQLKGYMESNNSHIKLDTEEIKDRVEIDVLTNTYSEIDSEDIFKKMRKYLME